MDEATERLQARLRTAFVALVLLASVFVVWSAADFRTAARLFPQYAGGVAALFCLIELFRQLVRRALITSRVSSVNTADIGLEAEERGLEGMKRGLAVFAWVLGYGVLIVLVGMPWATILFVPALLHLRFRSDWRATVVIVVGLLALMWVLRVALMVRLPAGPYAPPFLF